MNITTKGQVTIPKKIREKYGLNTGMDVEFIDDGNTVRVVKKGGRSPFDRVYGILRSKKDTDAVLEALRGR